MRPDVLEVSPGSPVGSPAGSGVSSLRSRRAKGNATVDARGPFRFSYDPQALEVQGEWRLCYRALKALDL